MDLMNGNGNYNKYEENTLTQPILNTDIPGVKRFITGKVRDVYDLEDSLLLVTTDRISAFDVVLPSGIPDKGRVLTQISAFWFGKTQNIIPNHLITTDIEEIAARLKKSGAGDLSPETKAALDGRSLLGKKCKGIPLECIVRGYLAGSAWSDYKKIISHGGEVLLHGHPLPVGLKESDKLPEPLFTPTTKATSGHDESLTDEQAKELVGEDLFNKLKEISIALYKAANDYASERGIILADTKFEFGMLDDQIILIDEALTPDSSRFWDTKIYQPGKSQPSFDKQYVRDYLQTLDWDKTPPGPVLPDEIVRNTSLKYREAYSRLTGQEL